MKSAFLFTIFLQLESSFTTASIPSTDEYKVNGLDKYGNTDDLYSGFMPLSLSETTPNTEGNFFFLFAKARNARQSDSKKQEKLVVWLNGGPGCSSMVGAMWENGPFSIAFRSDGSPGYDLRRNPFAWNEETHVLFVEQPIRTGFSHAAQNARKIHNEAQVSEDFYSFMKSFLTVFADMQSADVYITGESYAGMYIPYMAQYVLKHQSKQHLLGGINIRLKGVAIGNGAIDPIQDLSYSEYAYSHGLIPLAAKESIDAAAQKCYDAAVGPKGKSPRTCEIMQMVLDAAGRPNEYDTGTFKDYSEITQPGGVFDSFFNDPYIQESLHVRGLGLPGLNFVPESGDESDPSVPPVFFAPEKWQCCNDDINDAFSDDFISSVPALKYLSEAPEFRVLLYSGERDLNTNFLGTLHTLEASSWLGRSWASAARALWQFNGDVAGEYMSIDEKFSFLIVRNSGHLLPMNLPAASLEMLHRFLSNSTFADVRLPSEASYRSKKSGDRPLEGASGTLSTGSAFPAFLGSLMVIVLGAAVLLFRAMAAKKRQGIVFTSLHSVTYTALNNGRDVSLTDVTRCEPATPSKAAGTIIMDSPYQSI